MQYSRPSSFLGSIDLALPSRRDRGLPPALDDGGYAGTVGLTGNPGTYGEMAEIETSL